MTDLKVKTESNSIILIGEDFNTPLSIVDRTIMQKINTERQDLNNTVKQLDLTGIYRTFHPTTIQFSS